LEIAAGDAYSVMPKHFFRNRPNDFRVRDARQCDALIVRIRR